MTAAKDVDEICSHGRLSLPEKHDRLTHYMFRYPAKFHPPVARALLDLFSEEGDYVVDPFCGSGTLMVEAATMRRHSLGTDVDPLAVAVASAKLQRPKPTALINTIERLVRSIEPLRRSAQEYEHRAHFDLTPDEYEAEAATLAPWIPAIPNLHHWFRRYVIIDLAKLRRMIEMMAMPNTQRAIIGVIFASIIRNASNADPVPVSGLEVTRWMREKDAEGRIIDPFRLMSRALRTASADVANFVDHADPASRAQAKWADATALNRKIIRQPDAVITSPPYHNAVDYYRRHQLEMFWLGLTNTQDERLALLRRYVGRPRVPPRHPWVHQPLRTGLVRSWHDRIEEHSEQRAQSFRHYMGAMSLFFDGLARCLRPGTPVVLVVGHSAWQKAEIPTSRLFDELASDAFDLEQTLWYPLKNRYMSYSRHNGADIKLEHVMVLRRSGVGATRTLAV